MSNHVPQENGEAATQSMQNPTNERSAGAQAPDDMPPDAERHSETPRSEPLPKLRRKVDLSISAMALAEIKTVESLMVQELRGPGAAFTANLEHALIFNGIAYRPKGAFETTYQIVAGPLLTDSRVLGRMYRIIFLPAFAWTSLEMVLLPIKLSKYGQRVLVDLQSQNPHFPTIKSYIEWSGAKHRHVVYVAELRPHERSIIEKVVWPTREHVQEALSLYAYDNINDLAVTNEDVRILLTSREVK